MAFVMPTSGADVDVLVVGAGITGIYQLHRAREAGFSALLLEAGDGVGGTWFWNRYPGARFDSESYTYGYLFSQELFDEWEWQEHFAEQPETERYLNHVVDRFDLRRHMRFGATVTVGGLRRAVGHVDGDDRRRHRRSGPASSSPPPACCRCRTSPTCPGATTSGASSTTPAGGRPTPVDFAGKRVAVIGTGVERRAGRPRHRRRGRRRSPCTSAPPTGARRSTTAPITADEQAQLRADFEELREVLNTSIHGFLHPPNDRERLRRLRRGAAGVLREDVGQPRASRSSPATTSTCCSTPTPTPSGASSSPSKIRGIVDDPDDRRAADPEGPPLRREAPAVRRPATSRRSTDPNVSLVDLEATPIVRVTETRHRDDRRRARVRRHRVGDRLRLRHRRAAPHGHPRPGRRWPSRTTGPTVRRRSSASRPPASPTSSSPAGPHAAAGNNPRYNGDQVDFVTDTLVYARDHGYDVDRGRPRGRGAVDRHDRPRRGRARRSATIGQYVGGNIPGKPQALPPQRRRPPEALQGDRPGRSDDRLHARRSVRPSRSG